MNSLALWWLKDWSLYFQRRWSLKRHTNSQDHATTIHSSSPIFLKIFSPTVWSASVAAAEAARRSTVSQVQCDHILLRHSAAPSSEASQYELAVNGSSWNSTVKNLLRHYAKLLNGRLNTLSKHDIRMHVRKVNKWLVVCLALIVTATCQWLTLRTSVYRPFCSMGQNFDSGQCEISRSPVDSSWQSALCSQCHRAAVIVFTLQISFPACLCPHPLHPTLRLRHICHPQFVEIWHWLLKNVNIWERKGLLPWI